MHTQRNILSTSIALLCVSATSSVFAQGFALNEQSIVSMGSAHAGRATLQQDASVIYTNPAALSQLKARQFTGNATFIKAYSDINNASGTPNSPPASNDGDMVPNIEIASSFLALPMQDTYPGLSVGVGFYAPAGLATNYEDSFQGRAFGDKSKVKVLTLQPTMAYQISPMLSVGAGLTINRAEGELTSGLAATPNTVLGYSKLQGDDMGYGYNLGLLLKPMPDLDVGLNYKSKVDYTLEGTAEVRNVPVAASAQVPFATSVNGIAPTTLDITTPESIELAAAYRIQPDLTLLAGVTYTRWSRLKQLAPQSQFSAKNLTVSGIPASLPAANQAAVQAGVAAGTAAALNASAGEALNFKNAFMYSVGMAYQYAPNLVLRAGVGIDESPVTDEFRNVRLPTADRTMFSAGVGYTVNPQATVDLGYMYFFEDKARINRDEAPKGKYSATYENSAHLLGAQLTYKF